MLDKLLGVLTFNSSVYRGIAEDRQGTAESGLILGVVLLVVGLINGLLTAGIGLLLIPIILVIGFISWFLGAVLYAFVARTFFGGTTDTGEMLRISGYGSIFGLVGVIPIIGGLLGWGLSLAATVVGIREAAEFDTIKAILTVVATTVIIILAWSLVFTVVFGAAFFAALQAGGLP